eukprot:scaffold2707_cov417-Prasinococcus_capsulatus_cf.AAC.9
MVQWWSPIESLDARPAALVLTGVRLGRGGLHTRPVGGGQDTLCQLAALRSSPDVPAYRVYDLGKSDTVAVASTSTAFVSVTD